MSSFTLELVSTREQQRFENVGSFVGRDASGQFGLLPDHLPLATVLDFGLARWRPQNSTQWRYAALPGGTLHFAHNTLRIATRDFVVAENLQDVTAALTRQRQQVQRRSADLRQNLDRMEQALLDRLWQTEHA